MLTEILDMPIEFISGEPYPELVNSTDFLLARRKALEIAIEEDKWYLSKLAGRDVGISAAKDHFMDNHFTGFDEGFAAAYSYRRSKEDNEAPTCAEKNQIQGKEIENFILRFKNLNAKRFGRDYTHEEATEAFFNGYDHGFYVGFKVGFCGLACDGRINCRFGNGQKYYISLTDPNPRVIPTLVTA